MVEYKNEKVNKLMESPPTRTAKVIAVNLGDLKSNLKAYLISINIGIIPPNL
jgi:hypothetical protein